MSAPIDLDELAAAVAGPQVGDQVWSWHDDEVMTYLGPDEHGSQHVVVIGITGGITAGVGADNSGVKCPVGRVAPADVDVTSDRWDHLFTVAKGKGPSWLGNWFVEVVGSWPTWHKTKRAAVAAGRRRTAIVKWWAEHGTTDYAEMGDQA